MVHRSLRATGAIVMSGALLVAGGVVTAQSPAASEPAAPVWQPPMKLLTAATLSDECAKENLPLKNPGRLTLSTDNPAYGPWWWGDPATQYPGEPEGGSGWELGDPYSGEGYEAAVAYAVADALGFAYEEVDWIPNAVFEQAFAPGDKAFDWHMAQISINEARAQAVDFSDPYFSVNQAVLAMSDNPIQDVTTIEGLKDFKLGAATATTSFQLIDTVIQPNAEAQVFNSNADALQPLQSGTIDGLVVDLYTAFYMRDAQLENWDTPDPEAAIVGVFPDSAQTDTMGMVLQKDSPLTACVNEALAAVVETGTLDAIYNQWIASGQEIPFFQ